MFFSKIKSSVYLRSLFKYTYIEESMFMILCKKSGGTYKLSKLVSTGSTT